MPKSFPCGSCRALGGAHPLHKVTPPPHPTGVTNTLAEPPPLTRSPRSRGPACEQSRRKHS
uniref:Uncharacterized protein n=1 Tax=Arundo donax TaxID=35708 RepID=A0A0A9DXI8_ARUDO